MVLPLLLLLVLPKLMATADPETQKVGSTAFVVVNTVLFWIYVVSRVQN